MKERIANFMTLGNMAFGLLSLFLLYEGLVTYAAFSIVIAALIDSADGTVARFLKIDNKLGKELDNVSDVVTFIVATSVFSYVTVCQNVSYPYNLLFSGLLIIFVFSGLIRTSKLNTGEMESGKGFMTTFNVLIPLLYLLDLFFFDVFTLSTVSAWLILSAGMMVSDVKIAGYLKGKENKWI